MKVGGKIATFAKSKNVSCNPKKQRDSKLWQTDNDLKLSLLQDNLDKN